MGKTLTVLRKKLNEDSPYTQTFAVENEDQSVAEALEEINEEHPEDPIRFERSCMQKKCGACAMLIQGVPRLACSTRLSDFKEEEISLAPLRKFPTVVDLIVDRSAIQDNLKEMEIWLDEDVELSDQELEDSYDAARCLQCGCCLEVCPNFMVGDPFFGAAGTMASTRLILAVPQSERKEIERQYKRHVYNGCGKSLSCQNICPAEISIERLLSRANRMAVWHRNS